MSTLLSPHPSTHVHILQRNDILFFINSLFNPTTSFNILNFVSHQIIHFPQTVPHQILFQLSKELLLQPLTQIVELPPSY